MFQVYVYSKSVAPRTRINLKGSPVVVVFTYRRVEDSISWREKQYSKCIITDLSFFSWSKSI